MKTALKEASICEKVLEGFLTVLLDKKKPVNQRCFSGPHSYFPDRRTIVGTPDEETMDIILAKNYSEMVGIVFNDTRSYWLKFSWGHRIPVMREHFEYSGLQSALEML
ncbi:ATP-binding cassette sub-family A member 10-like [Neophocaena asiaeorientalis asiaeorientalis]|uniref:ATP-binding cassette sub-family A member 10-like n=1 Tax=Neophocaena asiaeorientalis asiaeorientalis TaxID=1706337 RepID=A0A341CNM6_NEOAA|nr:ATP-binding cassette sub-family A member 10-like [Neophocaena asiaeorientalis asiaeorientalis]